MAKNGNIDIRISYAENWHDEGEHFVFEWKFPNENEWRFDSAAPLCKWENGEMKTGSGDYVHYTALTKIRELVKHGINEIVWR